MINKHDPRDSRQSDSRLEYSGTEELMDSEEGLDRYNRDVVKKIIQGFGLERHSGQLVSVLEFGAGTGVLAEIWESDYGITPTCVEIAPSLQKILISKGFKTLDNIAKLSQDQGFIYTSNVLEHIEDDLGALIQIRSHLEIEGKLAIYVPALPFLFSDLDRRVGHFRRYRKSELINKVESAGFRIEYCHYNDCLGVLASLALKIIGYKNKAGLGSKKSLIFYDNVVYPISIILDKIVFKFLIGKNLLLIATNPKS
jgi:hypothetical protein